MNTALNKNSNENYYKTYFSGIVISYFCAVLVFSFFSPQNTFLHYLIGSSVISVATLLAGKAINRFKKLTPKIYSICFTVSLLIFVISELPSIMIKTDTLSQSNSQAPIDEIENQLKKSADEYRGKLPIISESTELFDVQAEKRTLKYSIKINLNQQEIDVKKLEEDFIETFQKSYCKSEKFINQKKFNVDEYYSYFDRNNLALLEIHLNKICN